MRGRDELKALLRFTVSRGACYKGQVFPWRRRGRRAREATATGTLEGLTAGLTGGESGLVDEPVQCWSGDPARGPTWSFSPSAAA